MKATWGYLRYVLRHKLFVLLAGLRVGAPLWRLLIHDYSKFFPSEWGPYRDYFYGEPQASWVRRRTAAELGLGAFNARTAEAMALASWMEEVFHPRELAFDRAWLHHQNRHPHHWQFWLLVEDNPPRSPWSIGSKDGGLTDHSLVRLRADGKGFDEAWLTGFGINEGLEADIRYRMLSRCITDANRYRALPMPEHFIREMVADWAGAGRAITGKWDVRSWYEKNRDNQVLHPDTRARVEYLLALVAPV